MTTEIDARDAAASSARPVVDGPDPAGAAAAARAGEAAFAAGDAEAGAEDFRRALALEPARLDRRLKLARLLAKAGLAEEASAEATALGDDPRVFAAHLAQAGDLEASLGRADRAAALFRRAVEAAGADAPADWWVIWTNQLERAASEAKGVADCLARRREAEGALRAALARLSPEAASKALITYRLVDLLLKLDDSVALAALADELAGERAAMLLPRELALVARLLSNNRRDGRLDAVMAAAWRADPEQLDLLTGAVRASLNDKAALAPLWPHLLEAERRRPDDQELAALVGRAAFELGEWGIAFERLAADGERAGGFDIWWRAGIAALNLGRDADADLAFARMAPRLPTSALGAFSAALPDLRAAVDRNYLFADRIDHAALTVSLEASRARLAALLAARPDVTAGALLGAAENLEWARAAPFRELAMVPSQFSYVEGFDDRYGTLDLAAFGVVNRALLEHGALLLGHGAEVLAGGGATGDARVLRDLPARLARVALELDRPAWARVHLQALREAGFESRSVERALERCSLHEGRIDDVAARRRATATNDPACSVHPTPCTPEWHEMEGLTPVTRLEEAGLSGLVDRVDPDGRMHTFEHRTTPFCLDVTAVRGLELRGEIVIGPKGGVLRPSEWHTDGRDYPRGPLVLAATRHGAVLRTQDTEDIAEPVVVLAGDNSVSVPNYYHWMTHQLARAVWAWREGWLEARRLVVPAEARPWMREALALAGIPENRLLSRPNGRSLRLADAWLVSAFDHPGKALIEAIREQLCRGACVGARRARGPRLFLVRPAGGRRAVFGQDRLLEAARGAGFECVEPAQLGIAEQVRLLAGAECVAGFDGAAMTNLMFARDGVRVLDLSSELAFWPDFPGIAIALGQPYRYLLGAAAPSCRSMRSVHEAPAIYDLDLFKRELDWVGGQVARRGPARPPKPRWDDLLARLAEGRAMAKGGRLGELGDLCRSLLRGRGVASVDAALGVLLRLLIVGGDEISIRAIGGDAFAIEHLASGWNPGGVSLAYLEWLRRRALAPDQPRDAGALRQYADALVALWPSLDEDLRLQHNLYRKLVVVWSELGAEAQLEALATDLVRRRGDDPRYEPALDEALRRMGRSGTSEGAARVVRALFDLAWISTGFTPALSAAAFVALTGVSRGETTLDTLIGAGRLLRAWWDATLRLGEGGADLLARPNVVGQARKTAEFGLLREWLARARARFDQGETRAAALSALTGLVAFAPGPDLQLLIEDLHAADPAEAGAALLLARALQAKGAPPARLEPILRAIRTTDPGYDSAISWLAHGYENLGQGEDCLRWLDECLRREPNLVQAKETAERVNAGLGRRAMPAEGGGLAEALAAPPAPLDIVLGALRQIVNGDLTHRFGPSLTDLRRCLDESLTRLENHRSAIESLPLATLLKAASDLVVVAITHFLEMEAYHQSAPIAPGPQYGALDPARYALVRGALHEHAMGLAECGLRAVLAGAPMPALDLVCQLAEKHVRCALALDRPARSRPLLMALASRGAPRGFIDRLLELCALQGGDIQGARALIGPAARADCDLHVMKTFGPWCADERLIPRPLHSDQEAEGRFEYVNSTGQAHSASHRVRSSTIEIVQAAGIRVRDTELAIGRQGTLLKPPPWHLRDAYGYPDPSPILVARALRGARLTRSSAFLTIDEPVVVLENMDALVYKNYYHWMLLILSRIGMAMDRDLLADRRLLLPVGLSAWMKESLELVGLPAGRVLSYEASADLILTDAKLLSSVEYPGASLLEALRERLWAGASAATERGSMGRMIWLSRRRQCRRALLNEEAVEAVALDCGFEIVVPEDMGVAEQIRLMAGVGVVAGAVGANLTNLAFARRGARVLGLVGEEEAYPTFVDLCAVMGHRQRWLFGRVDPRTAWWGPDQKPFEIDLGVARRELERVARRGARKNAGGRS